MSNARVIDTDPAIGPDPDDTLEMRLEELEEAIDATNDRCVDLRRRAERAEFDAAKLRDVLRELLSALQSSGFRVPDELRKALGVGP